MRLLFYLFLLTLITPKTFAVNEPFYLADDQDFPPYIYINDEGQKTGIVYEILTTIFSTMQQDLKYELFPWKRAQKMVDAGMADALMTIPTKERLAFLVASEPIITLDFTVHYHNDNPKWAKILAVKNIEELKNFQLIDYQGDGWAEENLKGQQVIWAPSYSSAVGMLALNRADIFLDDILSIKSHVKKQIAIQPTLKEKLLKIKHGEKVIYTVPLCLLIRRDSQYLGLINKFNQALNTIKENGEYQKIINKYTL